MNRLTKIAASLLALACMLGIIGCQKKKSDALSYEDILVTDHVRLGAYEGLTISLTETSDKGTAIWETILANSEILSYPEEAVAYYVAQAEERYHYYAEKNGVSVKEAMEAVGMDE